MASLYELFKTNNKLEKEGVTIDYGEAGKFVIARMGGENSAYAKYLRAKLKQYKFQIDTDSLPADTERQILLDVFVKTVLLGWDGVTDENGKEIRFSEENAKKLLSDLPVLFDDLRSKAQDYTNFRQEELKVEAKNSENTSAGN